MSAKKLGRYVLESTAGFGGAGEVYRAYDSHLHRPVAIKILREDSQDGTAREELLAEARAASALNHPGICTIYEVGEADGQAYLAMELVDGKPLRELIPAQGMHSETSVRYGIQIADALAHGHQKGVCHGDLSSSNIMVDQSGHIKILDFGLAKRFAVLPSDEPSAQGSARGRPAVQEDIKQFGAVLYEMATGLLLDSRRNPSPNLAGIGPALRVPIHRCLISGLLGGYEEIHEARDDLQITESGSEPRPPAPSLRSRGRIRWAVALITPIVLAGLVLGIIHYRNAEPTGAKPAQQSVTIGGVPAAKASTAAPDRKAERRSAKPAQRSVTRTGIPATRASTIMPESPGAPGVEVWANPKTGVYHCQGSPWYGKTTRGEYMTQAEAERKGYRAALGEVCQK